MDLAGDADGFAYGLGEASCVSGRICIWAMFRKDVSKRRLRFAIAAFSFTRKNICRENVRPADLDLGFG